MNGREEHEVSVKIRTDRILKGLPLYVSEWNDNLMASNKSIRTCNAYVIGVKDYLKFINKDTKNISPEQLTPVSLDKYFISLKTVTDKYGNKRRASDSRSATAWFILKNFFEFMSNRQYIVKNYVVDISCPKNKDLDRINEQRILLTKDDFLNIMTEVSKSRGKNKRRDMLIISLFMSTGMRASALMEIDLKNVDLENKRLYIIDKGEKRHEYILSDKIVGLFKEYYKQREMVDPKYQKEPLFINLRGERISAMVAVTTVGKYTQRACGKKLSPHKLRAGFCSILYEESHDIEFVRRAVGHSNSTTTQRYIVTNNSEKEIASKIMDDIF